jgi:RAD3-like DEAD/DEAH box helicase
LIRVTKIWRKKVPIPLDHARRVVESLQSGPIQNLFAQSHAKHVLYEVRESPDNFPPFDKQLDDKITFTAYAVLAASCSMLEQEGTEEGANGLETAASLLQNAHGPFSEISKESSFHTLVASMAYYASGHYSRAFVAIRKVEKFTACAGVIAAFIRKDTITLVHRFNAILLQSTPDFKEQRDLNEWVITVTVARSLNSVLEYILTGDKDHLETADRMLQDALVIAKADQSPSYWWIVRLLRLMFHNLGDASLWKNLPPFFDPKLRNHLNRYSRLLAFSTPPVVELWTSQRKSLSLALNPGNRGGVINLRTSAGKTRVAELAILQTLSSDPSAKILYLAPFRSLAFEVEQTLTASLPWLGFQVSHLYGGSRVSSLDTEMVAESRVLIATPEKARALLRAEPELQKNIRLIIIDEGHLIGPSERYVRNEIFIDHLRVLARSTDARMLLLSAVLPNAQELAEWLTGDPNSVVMSLWKPSAERFGLLRWNGIRVRIDWIGKAKSFNPSFIVAEPTSKRKNSKLFPANKTEAVAATAVRLTKLGPVMIFAGQAQWVPSMARSVLKATATDPSEHSWPQHEWKVFEAVCMEELEPHSIEMEAARRGIICHSNRLTPQVRMAMERLMRAGSPKVIIATTTLGQGVNIGISSVIVSSPYIGHNRAIEKRDFWNICGRAGRAFVDGEGKILYAIDEDMERIDKLKATNIPKWKEKRKLTRKRIAKDLALAKEYFDFAATDRVESGLLFIINIMRRISEKSCVSFDVLIELVANNDFGRLGENAQGFETILDLIDDELLAMHEDSFANNSISDSVDWIDRAFRQCLAAIQARSGTEQSTADDVIRFLRARAEFTLARIPDKGIRKAIVASGLPLSVAISAHGDLDTFRAMTDDYLQSDESLSSLCAIVQKIERWARTNANSITEDMPEDQKVDNLRYQWLGGVALREISENCPDAVSICRDLYGYQLPWIIHAISQKLDKAFEEERVNILSRIALLVEIGVPTELAAKIFLAGIRSRVSATELSHLDFRFGSSISSISTNLRNPRLTFPLMAHVSSATADWLSLVLADESKRKTLAVHFAPFKLKRTLHASVLHVRSFGDTIFLCSVDGKEKVRVKPSKCLPFDQIANDLRFAFRQKGNQWCLVVRDPRSDSLMET